MHSRILLFWIPTVLGVAFLLLGFALTVLVPTITHTAGTLIAFAGAGMLILAFCLTKFVAKLDRPSGGAGGVAHADGIETAAQGGRGGDTSGGIGGAGGSATALGRRSIAIGGDGGKG